VTFSPVCCQRFASLEIEAAYNDNGGRFCRTLWHRHPRNPLYAPSS
jgi:hypothetical protein